MNRILLALGLAAVFLLYACGESHLAEETSPIRTFVVVVPEKYTGDLENYPLQSSVFLDQNQTVKMYLGAIKDGVQSFGDEASSYFKGTLWNIDGIEFTSSNFRYTFKEAGRKEGFLRLVDYWNDTILHEFEILVNEPHHISIVFPYDGYNQANPVNIESIPLRWNLTGIDEWEDASCEIFASSNSDSLWVEPLTTVDCTSEVYLRGSLVGGDLVYTADSSFSFYWGVKATIYSEYTGPVAAYSPIARFSTKILDTLSRVKIPFTYRSYYDFESPKTEVTLIASNGDTLNTFSSQDVYDIFVAKVEPQSNLKIKIQSINRSDYAPESLIVDIPPNTVVDLDAIILQDKIKPQVAPYKNDSISLFSPISFYVYDDGSGIDEKSLAVVVDRDTVSHKFKSPLLSFSSPCINNCKIQILGYDGARNSLPNVYWNMVTIDGKTSLQGPFVNGGN